MLTTRCLLVGNGLQPFVVYSCYNDLVCYLDFCLLLPLSPLVFFVLLPGPRFILEVELLEDDVDELVDVPDE